ncbi:MAG: c-type cytochrome [Candidatus Sericytochromatia bacterium]
MTPRDTSKMKNFTALRPLLCLTLLSGLVLHACAPKAATWKWPSDMPAGPEGEAIRYGQELVAQTARYLGPEASDPSLRLAGNRLACTNCHLGKGTQANAAGFVGIAKRYPAYYAPLDRKISLEERISACFERSLNGKPLPDGKERQAFSAYLSWLSQEVPDGQTPPGSGLENIVLPARAADLNAGKKLYTYHCAACHGKQGEGVLSQAQNPGAGYTFPPVWGSDSYGEGSNLARLSVLARYIKGNMPLGRPVLSAAEAYDVAGYLNSQPRPAFPGAGQDYPNPATRPFDVPYGPYPDGSTPSAHRLGPLPQTSASP